MHFNQPCGPSKKRNLQRSFADRAVLEKWWRRCFWCDQAHCHCSPSKFLYDDNWMIRPWCLLEVTTRRPRTSTRGLLLHHDNTSSNTSARTLEFLHDSTIQLASHPPYSPELAPCDLFLFQSFVECVLNIAESAVEAFLETIWELTREERSEYFYKNTNSVFISKHSVYSIFNHLSYNIRITNIWQLANQLKDISVTHT